MTDSIPTEGQGSRARALTTRAFGLAIVVLGSLQLMVVLDGTVANLALARLQSDLNLTDSGRTWVLTSYALAFGGLMLLGGRLGDVFGRRKMFIFGVALFTIASLLCGVAVNEAMLLASRALQGVGAAIASPTAFALVATTFAPGKARNQAIAIFAAMTGLGSVAGLVIGGALTQVSWRWIFWINVPIGFVIVALAFFALHESENAKRIKLDVPGAVLATIGCTAVVFAMMEGINIGWASPVILGALALGLVTLALFLYVERTAENPLFPFVLFRNPDRVAALIAIFFAGAMLMAMTMYVALFVQDLLGYSPLTAGMAFIPFALGIGAGAQIASKLTLRVQPRWVVVAGAVLMVIGLLYGSTLDGSASYVTDLLPPTIVLGLGVGFAMVPLPLCAIAGVGPSEIGPLTAIGTVAQTLGGPIGIAVISVFATSRTIADGGTVDIKVEQMNPAELVALGNGYTFALVGCAIAAALAGVAALFMRFTPAQIAEAQAAEKAAQLAE